MQEYFRIGLIGKPHGIKGEVKVFPLTDDTNKFKRIKKVVIDGKAYTVSSAKIAADTVILALHEVTDRNFAETLRGKYVEISRSDEEPLGEFSFYVSDILGSRVLTDDGAKLGEVLSVTPAKTDVFTVLCDNGKKLSFPFLKDLLSSFDAESKTLVLHKKRLSEVALYED